MLILMDSIDLTNHFLIAMPGMADPHFSKTLTFICEHNERGAIGLVVNKPIDVSLGQLFEQVEILLTDEALRMEPVHFGGPVMLDRGFVLHRPLGDWRSTLRVENADGDVGLTTSRDILEAIASGSKDAPHELLVTLGYAGWGPGQLEDELARNGWISVSARPDLIFNVPAEDRLTAAMGMLGLTYGNLSDAAGHA
jgi:putative transcriptional regulator